MLNGKVFRFQFLENRQLAELLFKLLLVKTLLKLFAPWNIHDTAFICWLRLEFLCVCVRACVVCLFIWSFYKSKQVFLRFKPGIRLATIYKKPSVYKKKHQRSEVYMKTIVSHWCVDHTHTSSCTSYKYSVRHASHTQMNHAQTKKNQKKAPEVALIETPFRCNRLIQ